MGWKQTDCEYHLKYLMGCEYHSKYLIGCFAEVHSYKILKMFCWTKFLFSHQLYLSHICSTMCQCNHRVT